MNVCEHARALARAAELAVLDPGRDTPEGRELQELASEIEAYERALYPLDCCSIVAAATAQRLLSLLESLDEFYSLHGAVQWCELPQRTLGGKRPIDLITTEAGTAEILGVLARLRDGAYV
jgi:hypothetical protein